MGRTILCQHCKSTFNEDVLAKRANPNECPVCGKSLSEERDASVETIQEKNKWYYYQEGGGGLDDTLYENIVPLYTFDAVDVEDAKKQLKEVMPNSPLFQNNSDDKVRRPYCQSTDVQIVPQNG